MKKIRQIFILFILWLFFIHSPAAAFEPFSKHEDNPLPFVGNYPNWNETGRTQPHVFINPQNLDLWYSTLAADSFKIAYATSSGGLNWTGNTLLSLVDEFDNHDPSVLRSAIGYVLFFVGSRNGGDYRIYKVKLNGKASPDLSTLKIIIQPQESWEAGGVSAPFIFYRNQTYFLFYSGQNSSGTWNIGLATSQDGESWTRCPSNPILQTADGPHLMDSGNKLYLFFHSPDRAGIGYVETRDQLSCTTSWNNKQIILTRGPQSYDQNHVTGPSAIVKDGKINLYYSGLGSDSSWRINLATSPLTLVKIPVVIIPGFFGSWNRNAILHNQTVGWADWKLLPYVREYDGLTKTLSNLGYAQDKDYLLFPYDWRKSIEASSDDLKSYLDTKVFQANPAQKVNIVGHSLGGLVGRIYAQKYQDKINKVISVASPHQGTPLVYRALSAGEIDRDNTLMWLSEKLTLVLNKNSIEPDRETIKKLIPSMLDLLPTFNFLKKSDGTFITHDAMQVKNPTLPNYNLVINNIYDVFASLFGETSLDTTINGYITTPPDRLDLLLGNYLDGKPVASIFAKGDNTILTASAKVEGDPDSYSFNLDHGQMIYKKDPIAKILTLLQVPFTSDKISEGQGTNVNPALIFTIKSPAKMEVVSDAATYQENDGIIFIPDAAAGTYQLKITGTDLGKYTVYAGQVAKQNDVWDTIQGEISQITPIPQIDNYTINFNSDIASSIFSPTPTPLPTFTPSATPTVEQSPTPTLVQPTPTVTTRPTPSPTPTITTIVTIQPSATPTQSPSSNQYFNPSINVIPPTIIIPSQQPNNLFAQQLPQVLSAETQQKPICSVSIFPSITPTTPNYPNLPNQPNLPNPQTPSNFSFIQFVLSAMFGSGFTTLGFLVAKFKT